MLLNQLVAPSQGEAPGLPSASASDVPFHLLQVVQACQKVMLLHDAAVALHLLLLLHLHLLLVHLLLLLLLL